MPSTLFRWAVFGACAYESVALLTGRTPTLSSLTRRYPLVGAVLIGGLTAHFYMPQPTGQTALI